MSDTPNNPGQNAMSTTPKPEGGNETADFNLSDMLRDLVNKVPDTVNKAVERALNVRDTTVLIRLGEASSDALDKLVTAGVFKGRAEAATFLVDEGIKAQAAIFARIDEKMSEIERLREELRKSVKPD
ncbi:MAG: hypothetical protein ACKV2V_31300 [Blastocatellia bacterium]